jgi:ligand-binding SRPBCC domain-containing protein
MPVIELELRIRAPVDRVFDLSRSVELHVRSTEWTRERAVAGITRGLLCLHDEVTWEAIHFGVQQRLTSRIVAFDRPRYFRDSMIRGAFRCFDHDHFFYSEDASTRVRDRFAFESPLGVFGQLANAVVLTPYLTRFLEKRLAIIKQVAESDDWPRYLNAG